MKKFVFSILFLFILASCAECKQVLPENIVSSTIKINAVATGEKGKNFFIVMEHKNAQQKIL